MAKKNLGFFDQHIEKAALGICALGMLTAAYLSFGGGRFAVEGRTAVELSKAVADAAEQARNSILNAKPSGPEQQPAAATDPTVALQGWFGESATGLAKIARVESPSPRTQPFPPLLPFSAESLTAEKRNLVKLVTPAIPVAMAGRSALNFPESKPLIGTGLEASNAQKGSGTSVSWVSVGAQVDLIEQQANFIAERYPPGSYCTIVQVHLQRKDLGDLAKGWLDVNTYLSVQLPGKPMTGDGRISLPDLKRYKKAFDFDNDSVCRPTLPPRIAGDRVEIVPVPYLDEPPKSGKAEPGEPIPETPEVEASKRVKKWTDLAKAALNGKKPFKQIDLDAALILARAAASPSAAKEKEVAASKQVLDDVLKQLPKSRKDFASKPIRAPERLMPLAAHDLTALPGHTYVYRMRYEVLNVYAGNTSDLNKPADAEKLTLLSDWSDETRPVEIPSDIYFFLTKADKAAAKAVVTVLKRTNKGITKREYTVEAGEKIGKKETTGQKADFSTGVVCVDIDFDRLVDGKKETALVYADPADGALYERLLSKDATDPVFKKLSEFTPTPGKP